MKLAPSEVSRESVQVVLRDSTSISPDCSAVKRSLADSGTNLTLVGSLKIAAAIARQTSTSSPVQLPLSSGEEKPGRPWLTPQDSMPRSLTVLRVCADRGLGRETGGESKGENQGYTFHGKAFQGSSGTFAIARARRWADPDNPSLQTACLTGSLMRSPVRRWIGGRGRPLNVRRQNSSPRITERLASRVKGLTAVFCVLLLTSPARTCRPAGFARLRPR